MPLDSACLPSIASLRRRAQALALLDAIVCPEWEYRYYSFNAAWAEQEAMASMRNGSGDDWFILFGNFGAAIKGLDHESAFARDPRMAAEVQRQLPPAFDAFVSEPAFGMDRLSYCYWRGAHDNAWRHVTHPDPALAGTEDGSASSLALLVEPPSAYQDYAQWYFEVDIPLAAIEHIYRHGTLDDSLVSSLNPDVSLADVLMEATEIGYPWAGEAPGSP